jgi:hypothetical protein
MGARPRRGGLSRRRLVDHRDLLGERSVTGRHGRWARARRCASPRPVASLHRRGPRQEGSHLPRPAPGGGPAPEQSIRAAEGKCGRRCRSRVRPHERRFKRVCNRKGARCDAPVPRWRTAASSGAPHDINLPAQSRRRIPRSGYPIEPENVLPVVRLQAQQRTSEPLHLARRDPGDGHGHLAARLKSAGSSCRTN